MGQGEVSSSESFLNAVDPGHWTVTNLSAVDSEFALFELRHPPKVFQPRPHSKQKLPTNRRSYQRVLFARTQTLWRKNRARCSRDVLLGEWKGTEGSNISADKLHQFWQGIFEQLSKADNRQVQPKCKMQWAALDPIEIDEVKLNLWGFKTQTATGPDGQKLLDIKVVPLNEPTLLLNQKAYKGTIPTVLLEGKNDSHLKGAGNWLFIRHPQ